MPAKESTWRNQDLLHRIFAISGIVLTIATVVMFWKDNVRTWKKYQATAVDIDQTMNVWRQEQFATDEAMKLHESLEEGVLEATAGPISSKLADNFFAELENAQQRKLYTASYASDVEKIKVKLQKLSEASAKVATASQAKDEKALIAAQHDAAKQRGAAVDGFKAIATAVKIIEDKTLGERKFTNARLDAAKANLDIAVRDSLDTKVAQQNIDTAKAAYDKLNLHYQELATHRKSLDSIVRNMVADVEAAKKKLDESQAELARMETTRVKDRETYFVNSPPFLGKKFLNFPIIDGFGSPRHPENLWSKDLEQDYNFSKVRRFDRCTTCHRGMQKSLPGNATLPAYPVDQELDLVLTPPTAEEVPLGKKLDDGSTERPSLEDVYGIRLADKGLLASDEVTVRFVRPKSAGAKAILASAQASTEITGLELRNQVAQLANRLSDAPSLFPKLPGLLVGDVITKVDGVELFSTTKNPASLTETLLSKFANKQPVKLTIRRGLPSPYASHPRLDLFVGDSSPHKLGTFACTVCHEGQGSATDFTWASHTPSTLDDAARWTNEHGWFDNPHWIFPMFPKRFAESACLKCHHNVVELEPSAKFTEAPAPKVTHGYRLVEKYGCFGCHEVKGYDGPNKRLGPDMRAEPTFFAVAQGLLPELATAKGKLKTDDRESAAKLQRIESLAKRLVDHPEEDAARRSLKELLESDALAGTDGALLTPAAHRAANLLKDVETPGNLRKTGPSLRFVASKLDSAFLYDWLKDPTAFRPTTRMPKFFGEWAHLTSEKSKTMAHNLEPIEIRGIMAYLGDYSQKFEPLAKPAGVSQWSAEEKVARGKQQFEVRGCLACHTHQEFPDVAKFRKPSDIVQGPDLSGVGAKFTGPRGESWLYSWIKEPTKYHARTVMPNLYLDPEQDKEGKTFDPVDDIASYLASVKPANDWKPVPEATHVNEKLDETAAKSLKLLALEHLSGAFYEEQADKYYEAGVPAALRKELKGAEVELITDGKPLDDAQRLRYIGSKTISKYGCFGCHDIPGFEDAKPIGTGLADWGRKDPSKLAFEHITHYIGGHGGTADLPVVTHGVSEAKAEDHEHEHSHGHAASHAEKLTADDAFFHHAIEAGSRVGFIYQKLKEPRSYDYEKVDNKKYNEKLRMPKFPFSAEEREAVITFVLGLVGDPPREKYIFQPDARTLALSEGRKVLEKFNCAGCHILEAEQWKLSFNTGAFNPQNLEKVYPFLLEHVSEKKLAAAKTPDNRNRFNSVIEGLPAVTKDDGLPAVLDEDLAQIADEDKIQPSTVKFAFDLWKSTTLEGSAFYPGQSSLQVSPTTIQSQYAGQGGTLTRYLIPRVLELERKSNTMASGQEAYGWLPPPLMGEGAKVQGPWLHDFLLEPYPIRPATFLRMPKFNMSSREAQVLVNYFQAVDNANYPSDYTDNREDWRVRSDVAEERRNYATGNAAPPAAAEEAKKLDSAMKIVVNRNYCVQCHKVGDYKPQGSLRAMAPNLADVYRRLRPDYTRKWIANPKMIMPYTAMPINIPYDATLPNLGGISQDLYHGTSLDQVDGLVDLLMNFDRYAKDKTSIKDLVPPPAPATPEGAAVGAEAAETTK